MDEPEGSASGRLTAGPWLDRLALQIERVRDVGDAEAVHDMRVAAGRLSVWIEIAGRRALHDDLRWLRRSAARLRDVDVMLESDRAPQWEEALRAQRADELMALRSGIASTRTRALLHGLRCLPPAALDEARKGVRHAARRVLKAGARMSADESDPAVLHRVRRRMRRLRYALEWLDLDAGVMKKTQDAFGAFNDRVVELQHLESHPLLHVPEADVDVIRTARERAREAALEAWKSHRSDVRDLAHGAEPES